MKIDVRAHHIGWNESLRQWVERNIEFAVDRHRSRINRVSVYLTDLNGPRGGIDKLCQMTADLKGTGPVLILDKGDDLLAVINRASRRLGYRVGRNIQRRRICGVRGHRTVRAA